MAKEGIISSLEGAHAEMVNWTVQMADALEKEIGPRPFGLDSVPERTQIKHGAMIWDDANAWTLLLQSHGWQPGGVIPKGVIEYGKRLVRLKEKYPDEFEAGQKGAAGQRLMEQGLVDDEGSSQPNPAGA